MLAVATSQTHRQVVDTDLPRLGRRNRALDHSLELPDVAGPVVGHQGIDRSRRHGQASGSFMAGEKVLRQLENVALPQPQRRERIYPSKGVNDRSGTPAIHQRQAGDWWPPQFAY